MISAQMPPASRADIEHELRELHKEALAQGKRYAPNIKESRGVIQGRLRQRGKQASFRSIEAVGDAPELRALRRPGERPRDTR
jgi:hypothetical protein